MACLTFTAALHGTHQKQGGILMARWRLVLGVFGGMLLQFVIGSVYIAGNISVYVVSYMRLQGDDVTLQDAVLILPLETIATTFTLYIGTRLCGLLDTRLTTAIGHSVSIAATFCGSFCTRFWSFCLVYAVFFGLGNGISYLSPLIMGWSYFPKHKGRLTGAILFFLALGSSVFGWASTAIINPHNKKADITVSDGVTTDHYYSEEIANEFPAMMRWLSLCYLCISVLGVALLVPVEGASGRVASNSSEHDDDIYLPSLQAGVKHPLFRLLFFMALLSSSTCHAGYGLYLASAYKAFGEDQINDDSFLTTVGAVSFLLNGIARFLLAQAMDLSSFKLIYGIILCLQLCLSLTLPFVAHIKSTFFIWICFSMICTGGHFSLFAAVTAKLFGKAMGGTVYSLLFSTFSVSSILAFLLQLFLVKVSDIQAIGYAVMFWVLCGSTSVSLILLLWRFQEVSPWKVEKQQQDFFLKDVEVSTPTLQCIDYSC